MAIRGSVGSHFRGGIMSWKPIGNNQVRNTDSQKVSKCILKRNIFFSSDSNLFMFSYNLLWSLANILLQNVFIFFQIKFKNGAHILKKSIFYLIFTFLGAKRRTKIIQHISFLHKYTCFAHANDCWLPNFAKLQIHHAWFLFCMTPGVGYFSCHLEQSINTWLWMTVGGRLSSLVAGCSHFVLYRLHCYYLIHSAYAMRMPQPIWIQDTQNTRK